MKSRVLALGIPVVVVAGIFGGGFIARKLGIPDDVWYYLWPSLVAVAYLAFTIGILILGSRRWVWPFLAGFVFQALGILLLWLTKLFPDGPGVPTLYAFCAALGVLAIILIVWLATSLRARWLERKMLEGVGAEGMDPQELAKIRKSMTDALGLLKKAGSGRNAIYELPWFLVIGRSQGGKTIAIKNSGLGLPVRKDWVKGVGGTHTCDFFFTNDVIFLDTPGAWVDGGLDEQASSYWSTLLKLLRKYRGRRPLDGLIVVVPSEDLLGKTEQECQEQASRIREVIDHLQDELRFRVPVYVLVSKCDLVDGFVDFFRGVPAQRWDEIVGWSNPDPNEGEPIALVPKGFRRILKRLHAYRLEILARSQSRIRKVFFFPDNFKRLEGPLTHYTDVLFYDDPSHETPVFRGFYFTSGTQGEGTVFGEAMSQLARTLGVRLAGPLAGADEKPKDEAKRGYFLKELYRHLMVGDEGLVARTAVHWWKRRRDTMFAAFLPAAVAGVFLVFSTLSYLFNVHVYKNIETDVPKLVRTLDDLSDPGSGAELEEALASTRELWHYHHRLDGFTLFRGLGMRRPGALADESFQVFREQFESKVLRPTLERAKAIVQNPDSSCLQGVDVFYAVVWLRRGRKAEGSDDLRGLESVWGDLPAERVRDVRSQVLKQFSYLKDHAPADASLLPGFSLAETARTLKDRCAGAGAGTAREAYFDFQDKCATAGTSGQYRECFRRVQRVANFEKDDAKRLHSQLRALQSDLFTLTKEGGEREAEDARDSLKAIDVREGSADRCVTRFGPDVVSTLRGFVDKQPALIKDCKAAIGSAPRRKEAAGKFVREQAKDDEKKLRDAVSRYAEVCGESLPGGRELDASVLLNALYAYRRVECLGEPDVAIAPARAPRPVSDSAPKARGDTARPSVRVPSPDLLVPGPRPTSTHTKQGWTARRQEWIESLSAADGYSAAEAAGIRTQVRSDVDDYASRYVAAWQRYLDGTHLKGGHGDVPRWIQSLASSTEFAGVLGPAAVALTAEPPSGMPELDGFSQGLDTMRPVVEFVGGKLGKYQALLRKLGEEMAKFDKDPAAWPAFRNALEHGSETNALVQATNWVDENASPTIAKGALGDLLREPLAIVTNYVTSPSLTVRRWKDLEEAYRAAAKHYPFSGDVSSDLVTATELKSLLGGASGVAPALWGSSEGKGFSEASREWLGRVAALSPVFFDAGKDDTSDLKLRLTLGEVTFDPSDLSEDHRLEKITLDFGDGKKFSWAAADAEASTSKQFTLALAGDAASQFSALQIVPAEKKGKMGRAFSKTDWKPIETEQPKPITGPWAAMQLLARGHRNVAGQGNEVLLTFPVSIPYKKNKPATMTVEVRASAPGLGRLLALAAKGLEPPPPQGSE